MVTHSGGIPGISTRVAFLPNVHDGKGMGVVVLVNADAKARAVIDVVYEVVDRVLGLERVPRKVKGEGEKEKVKPKR